ncbi:hypothetical protein EST38_g8849 [Candolleomyces aberdarensis]|uniref:Nephrocystin 3-like N-terminal domain-containing protein n=1 Tax=Candolleomyces aberdarensis TaxID=2316362 RepID=A0A4Q2DBG4_9AGAR|nr:hypothetical protein EST38_g8849 [Candolleomyces aberdarensis]
MATASLIKAQRAFAEKSADPASFSFDPHRRAEEMAFANASNFTMDNTQFNAIADQTNIYQSLTSDNDPLRILLNHSAINAMADSPSASYAPTCHPGTREAVIGRIMAWARDRKATPILWLSGPAGAGKSCIQRKIVKLCADEGLFGACFFFSTSESETSSEARFITTLAAQLAENIPGLHWYIESAIKMDRRMFARSLESQVEGLILKPLQDMVGSMSNRLKGLFRGTLAFGPSQNDLNKPWTRSNIIVIDGLDECVDEKEHAHILHLIYVLASHPHFPFRFVVASRPEYAIRTAFSSSPLSTHTLILRLEEYEADEDIRRYLKAELNRLKSDHPASTSIPVEWPSIEDEDALVVKASRQFVYVSVVMKHLDNPRRNPVLELRRIIDHRPSECDSKSNPFAELDALYNRILHPPDVDIPLLKSILHAIIHQIFYSFKGIDAVLDLAPVIDWFSPQKFGRLLDIAITSRTPIHFR